MDQLARFPQPDVSAPELDHQVRAALGEPDALTTEVRYDRLSGGELASQVYCVSGTARVRGECLPWRLILKVIRPTTAGLDERGIRYWKREALMYRSGFLAGLPGGLSGPRCYQVVEAPDEVRLWLEYLVDDYGPRWTLQQYGQVARSLGRFNGAYLAGHPFPAYSWVVRGWLRKYVEHAAPGIELIRHDPQHPVVRFLFPGGAGAALALWEKRHALLDLLEGLPQTFCHQDAFRGNLFVQGERLQAIDWSYMGDGPLGAEIVPLVLASIGLSAPELTEHIEALDQSVFLGYLDGLRDIGWPGDAREVRLAYTLTAPLRYILGALVGELLPVLMEMHTAAQRAGQPPSGMDQALPEDFDRRIGIIDRYYAALMDESARLMGKEI